MTDIVERLRVEWQDIGVLPCIDDMNAQRAAAADEIERLRAALRMALDDMGHRGSGSRDEDHYYCEYCKADHPDPSEITHKPGCKVNTLRRFLDGGNF